MSYRSGKRNIEIKIWNNDYSKSLQNFSINLYIPGHVISTSALGFINKSQFNDIVLLYRYR